MHVDIYKQKMSNIFAENRLLKLAVFMMVLISLMNWHAIQKAMDSTKTIVVPMGAVGALEVGTDTASDEYLRAMSRYIVGLLGTYTASTARDQFEEILPYMSPEGYAKAKQHFDNLADRIERYPNIASVVHWSGRDPLQIEGNILKIQAQKKRLVNGNATRVENIHYEIKYEIRMGRFYIVNISEVKKDL